MNISSSPTPGKGRRGRSPQEILDGEIMRLYYERCPGGRKTDRDCETDEELALFFEWLNSPTPDERAALDRNRTRKNREIAERAAKAEGRSLREYTHNQTEEGHREKASACQRRYMQRKIAAETPEQAAERKERQRIRTAEHRARKKAGSP